MAASLTILAFFCVSFLHFGTAEELDHKWSCGTTWRWERPGLTISWSLPTALSEAAVDKDCPSRKNRMNNCCVVHDNCYTNQLGQNKCDDAFCDCLETATEGSKTCSVWEGPGFCRLVRTYGESAYRASAAPTWSGCGTVLATANYMGCKCGYKTWERCGFLYMGYRYLCFAC